MSFLNGVSYVTILFKWTISNENVRSHRHEGYMMERILITGGAGFIGSHLVDRLIDSHEVVVLDDLSAGTIENLQLHLEKDNFNFIRGSITNDEDIRRAIQGVSTVYHFAAQPDVKLSVKDPMRDFEINVVGSMKLLEAMRTNDIPTIVFASSGGTVYGEPKKFPTPEDTPLAPISNYGAAKCAIEMYLSSYASLYGFKAVSLRFANIFGPRLTHGVMFDFYHKLKRNPSRLEILGNGKQTKAYMYIDDAIDAVLMISSKMKEGHVSINISSGECINVNRIAEITIATLGLSNVHIEYTGGERGWSGDVPITNPDIATLRGHGWKPSKSIEERIAEYIQWLNAKYGDGEFQP